LSPPIDCSDIIRDDHSTKEKIKAVNNKKVLLVGVVIAILSLVLVACGGRSGSSTGVTVTLKGQDIKFDLKEIKAKANQTVTVNYVNEGSLEHNFVVKEFNVKETIPAGGKKTITFTPSKAGTFDFACDVPGHTEAGMVGKLIVET
jgi:uncharacterized cupredoxin-like copper-binding protein